MLPAGFHRVRRFGWLHPGGRQNFNRVRALLGEPPVLTDAERAAWQPAPASPPAATAVAETSPSSPKSEPPAASVWWCPQCDVAMICVGNWRAGQTPVFPGVKRVREPP